eukprot:6715-Heterococcus_DN1.PRE.3
MEYSACILALAAATAAALLIGIQQLTLLLFDLSALLCVVNLLTQSCAYSCQCVPIDSEHAQQRYEQRPPSWRR